MTAQANTTALFVKLQLCDSPTLGRLSGLITIDGKTPLVGQTISYNVGGGVMDKALVTAIIPEGAPSGIIPRNYTSTEACGDFASGYGDDDLSDDLSDDLDLIEDDVVLSEPGGVNTAGYMGIPKIAWLVIIGGGLYYAYSKGMFKKILK